MTRVERGGALQQLEQPLALRAPRRLLRVLGLDLQLDAVAVREELHRLREAHPLGLLHEREAVAALPAAEAVIELVGGVDPERRGPLVVERAQALVAVRSGALELGSRPDQLDHVDGVAHALAGVRREARHHRANALGTVSSSNARMQYRSVMPAIQSVTRCATSPSPGGSVSGWATWCSKRVRITVAIFACSRRAVSL